MGPKAPFIPFTFYKMGFSTNYLCKRKKSDPQVRAGFSQPSVPTEPLGT